MAKLVWSSDSQSACPRCGHPARRCACSDAGAATYDATRPVRVRRETKGRRGKGVTVVENVPLPASELKALARELKQRCGSGGTVKGGTIEIQGEHRDASAELIRERGWRVVIG